MKFARVEVQVAVEDDDDATAIVDGLIMYALGRGMFEQDFGMGQVHLIEERPIAVDEDGVPVWASVREAE